VVQESEPVTQADEKVEQEPEQANVQEPEQDNAQEPEQDNAQEQDAEEADPSADMAFTDDDK